MHPPASQTLPILQARAQTMKITPRDTKPVMFHILHSHSGTRSAGLHLSNIIHSLAAYLEPEKYGKEFTEDDYGLMTGGMGWEDLLFNNLVDMGAPVMKIGELAMRVRDVCPTLPDVKIFGTPDWFSPAPTPSINECKWTKKSCSKWDPERDYSYWWWQIQFYCYCMGVTNGTLYVMHVNGDYRTARQPTLVCLDVEFSSLEIHETVSMLVNHASAKGMIKPPISTEESHT